MFITVRQVVAILFIFASGVGVALTLSNYPIGGWLLGAGLTGTLIVGWPYWSFWIADIVRHVYGHWGE